MDLQGRTGPRLIGGFNGRLRGKGREVGNPPSDSVKDSTESDSYI